MKGFGKLLMIGIFFCGILVAFVVVVVGFLLPFWSTFLPTVSAAVVNFIRIHFPNISGEGVGNCEYGSRLK